MKSAMLAIALFFSAQTSWSEDLRPMNEIKQDIFTMAESFKGQTDPDGSKKKALEVLIKELMQQVPARTMQERAVNALGVWNQVWGPYAFDGSDNIPPGQDPAKIYQYISDQGFYYNFGEFNLLGLNIKFYVKGEYEITDDRINVEFTNQGIVREREVNYATLGDEIEADTVRRTQIPGNIPPVGVKGGLVEVYADDELRINYGVVGSDLSDPALFIMRRVR